MPTKSCDFRAASDVDPASYLKDAFYAADLLTGRAYTVLELIPEAGRTIRLVVPRSQANRSQELYRLLDDAGMPWVGEQVRQAIRDRVRAAPLRADAVITSQVGWHDHQYVLGDGTVLGKGREIVSRSCEAAVAKGEFNAWRSGVAETALYSSTIATIISAAFAAPLMRKVGVPSCVLNFFGTSSTGKSTGAKAAYSVDGNPDDLGSWDISATGVEEQAPRHNDSIFPLDEMGQAAKAPEDVANNIMEIAFKIAARRGRTRSVNYSPEGTARPVVLGISTSELSVTEYARTGGRKRILGDAVRIIDIPIVSVKGKGLFDRLPDSESSNDRRTFMDETAARHHGIAKREFIRRFLEDENGNVKEIERWMEKFRNEANISNELWEGRFGNIFALLYAAARLASRFGILPWRKDFIFEIIELHYRSARMAAPVPRIDSAAILTRVIDCMIESDRIIWTDAVSDYEGSTDELDGFMLSGDSVSWAKENDLIYAVKGTALNAWLDNDMSIQEFGRYLRRSNLIVSNSRDVPTMQIEIPGIMKRHRYYCLSQRGIEDLGSGTPNRSHRR